MEQYIASDGSLWLLECKPKPIPTTVYDWDYWAEDYDGAPDAYDDRHGAVSSRENAISSIEEWIQENAETI
jgi:hypothetical protein